MRRPLIGTILGIVIGLATAIVLQRQGVWPPDQLTIFLLPALLGGLGLIMLSVGREGSTVTLVISLIILIPMAVWGALGFGAINEKGELNGGCQVNAASDLDETSVVDTSRQDPFAIDPDGGLFWAATSPTVFMDYPWEIHVVIGGIAVPLDSDIEPNDGGSLINGDEVSNVRGYAAERGIDIDTLTGVYEVGGFASTCDGFGFVKVVADGFDTISIVALAIAVLLLIILIILVFTGRGAVIASSTATVVSTEATGLSDDAVD